MHTLWLSKAPNVLVFIFGLNFVFVTKLNILTNMTKIVQNAQVIPIDDFLYHWYVCSYSGIYCWPCCLFFSFEEGCFLPLPLSLFLLHHVLFWSFVYQAFWRSWLNLGGRISSILSPILIFFSPLQRPKSEHFCGQIGERISVVKIGDAPPKSELLASLLYDSIYAFKSFNHKCLIP